MTTEKETTIEPEQQVPSEAPGTQAEGQTAETQAGEEAAAEQPADPLAELQQKYDELNDRYLRMAAEYDNFRNPTLTPI